jgi:tetratricopeptide (TPR) repeat protein
MARAAVLLLLAVVPLGCATPTATAPPAPVAAPSAPSAPGAEPHRPVAGEPTTVLAPVREPRPAPPTPVPPAGTPRVAPPAAGEVAAPPVPPAGASRPAEPPATTEAPPEDVAALREALRAEPARDDVRHRLARALLARERAAAAPGEPPDAYLALGQALLARGDAAEALPWLREALRLRPHALEARTSLALALQGVGDLDAALEELRRAVRLHPGAARARLALATALVARQDWPAARRELEALVAAQPDLLQARYSLGVVRYAQGDLEGAITAYREVLALDPEQHDARESLALVLTLARRDAEATEEHVRAAEAGLPRAQYFAGTAHAAGTGVEPSLARAIGWWMRAAEQGVPEAQEALALHRQVALGRARRAPADRHAAEAAFREYRTGLRRAFADLAVEGDEPVGEALLRAGRVDEAVVALLREAAALSEPALRRLEALYAQGVPERLAPYDPRILAHLRTAAAEGQPRARIALARVQAHGLGVPRDLPAALALLRATPHEDARRLLGELAP